MPLSNESLEEYKNLNSEIGRNSQIIQNVFLGNVVVTAAIFGYGLNVQVGAIFLAPFAIIIPSLYFLASQLESTTRIAAYIIVFFEDKFSDLNWESRWLSLRKNAMPNKRKYIFSIAGLYGLLSIVCLVLALKYWYQNLFPWFFIIVTPILIIDIIGIISFFRSFSLKLCDEYVSAWKKFRS
jgi:hypothetical protein